MCGDFVVGEDIERRGRPACGRCEEHRARTDRLVQFRANGGIGAERPSTRSSEPDPSTVRQYRAVAVIRKSVDLVFSALRPSIRNGGERLQPSSHDEPDLPSAFSAGRQVTVW
jgi:hypothetical protein